MASEALRPSSSTPSLVLPGLKEPFPVSRSQEAASEDDEEEAFSAQESVPYVRTADWACRDAGLLMSAAPSQFTSALPSRTASEAPSPRHARPGAADRAVGTWVGGRSQWASDSRGQESFSDVSTVMADECSLHTPAQLQPAQQWSPRTPAMDEEPPPYDAGLELSALPLPGTLRPAPRPPEARRAPMQTQPCIAGIPAGMDFVTGGQDLSQMHARLPTPSRSQRRPPGLVGPKHGMEAAVVHEVRDAAVQVNRHSIDGHASRACGGCQAPEPEKTWREAPGRSRLASIIRSRGAPEDECAAATPGTNRNAICSLQYPGPGPRPAACEASPPDVRLRSWQGRASLAQALSKAVSEELAELTAAWGLGAPGGERRLEEVVAKKLRCIALRGKRACVVQALRPRASTQGGTGASEEVDNGVEQEEDLRMQCKQLEAEIAAVDERIIGLKAIDAEIDQVREAEECEHIRQLVAKLSAGGGEGSTSPRAALPASGPELEQCLQRLALVDLWFQRTFEQLEDVERGLDEREREASQRAFAHLPSEALDRQRALMRLR